MRVVVLLLGWALFPYFLAVKAAAAAPPDGDKESAAGSFEQLRAEIVAWRRVLDGADEASLEERKEAVAKLTSLTDERAVPILMDLWKKEKSPQKRKLLVSGLESIGTRKAFNELVKISCEDANLEVRTQAAKWIAKQENREDAIPQFVKYLKGKKFFRNALTSLGYTEIAKKAARPDPDLVAALIDNLITIIPKRTWVPVYRWQVRRVTPSGTWGRGELTRIPVVEYEKKPNEDVRQLLYQYTLQDHSFDQQQWRKDVLSPLQKAKQSGRGDQSFPE